MAERKPAVEGAAAPGLPTPEESWQRNMEILDLVNQIREARRRRLEEAQAPGRPGR